MATEDFFTDSTVTEVVEANIRRVGKLEDQQQEELLRIFKNVRRELQDRLLTIPEGTFTEQQLNVTLVQIESAIQTINQSLKTGLIDSAGILTEQSIRDLVEEIERFSGKFEGIVQPINLNAILAVVDRENFLINKYQSSIDAYTTGLRSQITSNIAQSMILRDASERTVSRLTSDIGKYFQGEEWRLRRIVRTELHNVYNYSKMKSMIEVQNQTIPDLKKSLMHPMDARTGEDSKKLANLNPVVDIDEPFRFKFKGEERVFQFPPDRPNDRSILVPFREEWAKNA